MMPRSFEIIIWIKTTFIGMPSYYIKSNKMRVEMFILIKFILNELKIEHKLLEG